MTYSNDLRATSCTQADRTRPDMIQGRGGGYGFAITDMQRLRRFLILGHEGGTYYAVQRTLSIETVDCIDRLIDADPTGLSVVNEIVEVSQGGLAPKNDPAIFALAYVASRFVGTQAAGTAMKAVPKVCRIGTHLFTFLEHCKTLGRGWGTGFKNAVSAFYIDRSPLAVAKQVTKYKQRGGWSHRDVLRKCHAVADTADMNQVFKFVTQETQWLAGHAASELPNTDAAAYLAAVTEVQIERVSNKRRCELIRRFNLPREVLPTQCLNDVAIWDALLQNMPLTAMIRNLGKMTNVGLIKPLSQASQLVVSKLHDAETLKNQRVHPISILLALKTYASGDGFRGSLSWVPDQSVMGALDDAFYAAFENVVPTGKRLILGVDVSGSMGMHKCLGSEQLTAREAAVAMAMLTARTESQTFIHGFSDTFRDLGITNRTTLADGIAKTRNLPFNRTRVALPIEYALEQGIEAEGFVVFTDNETNVGPHPYQKLQEYRDRTGIPAKMAVLAFANTNFTVADPNDAGMMDFAGFDASVPTLLNDFLS